MKEMKLAIVAPLLLLATLPAVRCLDPVLDSGGLSRRSFPQGFVFGAATSAAQVEGMANGGGRGPSIWDAFVRIPGMISGNATTDVTADQYYHYKEDVDIVKKFGFDAYRFSISWSRIFPDGAGRLNQEGVDYYNHLIDYMIQQGITPYATLYHWDLPLALQEKYLGWLSPRIVDDFADYADFCFKTYGDRVKNWFTLNEPKGIAAAGYDSGVHAPGRCTGCPAGGNSATEPYTVAHYLILSHAAAVNRYRENYQATQRGKIGICLDFVWFEPQSNSNSDVSAAQRASDFYLGWFLDPITYGRYPDSMIRIVGDRLPRFTSFQSQMVKGSIDYLGINHYTTFYATAPRQWNRNPISYQEDWHVRTVAYNHNNARTGEQANSKWLYIVPWGINKAVSYVKEKYNNPIMIITENGMDQPGNINIAEGINDMKRIEFYRSYISELKRAIDGGARVIGYFAWSLLDNFEWRMGFTSRFGIVYVDFSSLKRYPKRSAFWFQSIIKKN